MATLKLLSTDFDGTLIGHSSDGRCSGALAEALTEHRRSHGLWAVNTGRGLDHTLEGLEIFGAPSPPDFLLTNEREVFRRSANGHWEPHGEWNDRCTLTHEEFYDSERALFDAIRSSLDGRGDVRVIEENGKPAGLVTADENIMESITGELLNLASETPKFSFQRNTVYLRFCHADYDKGTALAELCRLEGLVPADVFAVGDHYNDLPMLHPARAAHLACPSNAIEPVKRAVRSAGGILATQPYADGVAEALMRHFS